MLPLPRLRRAISAAVAAAMLCTPLMASDCNNHGSASKSAGSPSAPVVPPVKPTWPAPKSDKDNPKPQEVAEVPPPLPPAHCGAVEDPLPTGLSVSFGAITGTVYSACEFPEQPTVFEITLTLLVKLADGSYFPVKNQSYGEVPGYYPTKSPYTITADCLPGTYALKMEAHGTQSDGKLFKAGPTQGSDFEVTIEDCP